MKNKNVRGILALAVVTALSFAVILGSKALAVGTVSQAGEEKEAEILEELEVNGAENIEKAARTEDGYLVTVRNKGYGGDIVMDVFFGEDKKTVTQVKVKEQSETPNLGARIAEAEFLDQFKGVEAPVYLPGMSLEEDAGNDAGDALEGAAFQDGTYEAKAAAADNNGFTDQVTVTVKDGKITEVVWDSINGDGEKKSELSENGGYTMTEDGLTWKAQSEALAAAVIENQGLGFLNANEQGKTDAVSGVSIAVTGFAGLAEECLLQAAGLDKGPARQDGTYEAKAAAADNNGFTDQVTVTVKDGKIAEVVWDSINGDGEKKSELSENGGYTMTEDGLTWKAQSEALAAAVVENQGLGFLNANEQGKTDAVSGVSIAVTGFAGLVDQCLRQAEGAENEPAAPQSGTQVDAVSGATISSTAAVKAINIAYEFMKTV